MPCGKARSARNLDHGIGDLVRIVGGFTVGNTEIPNVHFAAGDERANEGPM
jgi:hypothetical protein